MTGALVLRPLLDAVAPEDPAAAARRVRFAAIWLAIAAWLLPEFPGLGTDSVPHRAWICAAFVAAAVAAHFRTRHRWAVVALPVASCTAAALVALFGHGAFWGLGFVLYAILVLAATDLRNRYVHIAPSAMERDPMPPHPGGVPRALSAYAWFGISILFMLRFVGQAMTVPTGSMQPTIMGGEGRTPSWAYFGMNPGDTLFVDQSVYLFRDPRRWEIVVFKYPLFRDRNFVKRLIGLPGEHIEIRGGDIWVNGKVATKPPLVQATMWRGLFPRKLYKTYSIAERFQSTGDWKQESPTQMLGRPGASGPTFARFIAADTEDNVPDYRVAFAALPQGATSSAVVRITSRGTPVTLTVSISGAGTLSVGKDSVPVAALLGSRARVELRVVDGEASAFVDDAEVARLDMPSGGRGENRIEIGASGGPVSFTDIHVDRDTQYVSEGTVGAWDVPGDGFFFIGDNQGIIDHKPASLDSRLWTVTELRTSAGEVFHAAASIVTNEGKDGPPNVREEGGMWRFLDVDAVPREVPREGTKMVTGVPWPFATRSHLIGRAMLIFFPFGTPDAGFRPRFLP